VKLRRTSTTMTDKVDIQMTPMIDIVFQLLTFFLFSFKIATIEGDFNIRMPLAGPGQPTEESQLPIKVRLTADADGNLTGIQMSDRPIGSFRELHEQVMSIVGSDAGPSAAAENTEAELDCDYNLKYENVIRAITAISGTVTPDGHIVKLIQKIKFAPPKKPG
jgi:biopolymer transport protein ExbD